MNPALLYPCVGSQSKSAKDRHAYEPKNESFKCTENPAAKSSDDDNGQH